MFFYLAAQRDVAKDICIWSRESAGSRVKWVCVCVLVCVRVCRLPLVTLSCPASIDRREAQ